MPLGMRISQSPSARVTYESRTSGSTLTLSRSHSYSPAGTDSFSSSISRLTPCRLSSSIDFGVVKSRLKAGPFFGFSSTPVNSTTTAETWSTGESVMPSCSVPVPGPESLPPPQPASASMAVAAASAAAERIVGWVMGHLRRVEWQEPQG